MKIIFIHDLGQDQTAWFESIRQLSQFDCYCYSYNDTFTRHKIANYQNLKQDLAEFLSQEKQDFILCGQGLGGKLAIEMAYEYPQVAKGLVLVSTQVKEKDNLAFGARFRVKELLPKQFQKNQAQIPKEQMMNLLSSIRDLDLIPLARQMQIPCLIINAGKDRESREARQTLQENILYHQTLEIDSSNKNLNQTHPQEIARALEKFVENIK